MSTRSAVIWLAVALLLGGAAYLAIRGSGPAERAAAGVVPLGGRVLDITPAGLEQVRVTSPEGRTDTLTRRGDGWVLTFGESARQWPVAEQRVSGFLRFVADLRAAAEPETGASLGDRSATAVLMTRDGSGHTLRVSDRALGGNVLVEAEAPAAAGERDPVRRRALVSQQLYGVLTSPGPRGWRDPAALPGVVSEASRLRVETRQGALELARRHGRWWLTAPVAAPADAEKMRVVLEALAGLTVSDFLDDRPADAALAGLDDPLVRITVGPREPEAAEGAPRQAAGTHELIVGGPADQSGRRYFARLGVDGPIVQVDAAGLGEFPSPADLVARQSLAVGGPDVGQLMVAGGQSGQALATYQRTASGWAALGADGSETLLAPADASAVGEALLFLSERPAAAASIAAPPGYFAGAVLVLSSPGGRTLDQLELGLAPPAPPAGSAPAGEPALVVRSGGVWRSYPLPAAPRLLRDALGPAGATPEPPPADPADVNK
ncbi:MAG TPA: DUF4340 domain-containing protein [Phycisphaerales bacterium]|nr:DUF4340 domain-containing protein [Phycisphaerales bacterium]